LERTDEETQMTAEARAHDMARMMDETRAETMRLFALVPDEADLRRPPSPGFRPILWHRGHIGAYEAYWILQHSKGDASPSERYEAIFDPIKTPREDASNLPPLDEIDAYLAGVRERSLAYLRTPEGAADWYTFHLVLEHELQHQETLLYLLHLLEPEAKRRLAPPPPAPDRAAANGEGVVTVPAGSFEMGSTGHPFAYDNEQPVHRVDVAAFRLDRRPVTNAQFAGFVDGGGYAIPEYWSDEGWAWREANDVEHPHAWVRDGRGWLARSLFEPREIDPSEPVWGVSWYEADAYARWAGRRLPTEVEWEYAARGPESSRYPWGDAAPAARFGNFDNLYGGPAPAGAFPEGASPFGALDMAGNVWEWTATPFDGYPGFAAFPYPEYSETWFDGDHRVARGASWATRPAVVRSSFRNFFRRNFRIGFVGFRLAD
jgi:iron(II)-dependent oxidoreductase